MDALARRFDPFDPALGHRTRHQYARIWERWRIWAIGARLDWPDGAPLDLASMFHALALLGKADAAALAERWIAMHRDAGRSSSTLTLYTAAIVTVIDRAHGLGVLPFTLRGVIRAPRGRRSVKRQIVTIDGAQLQAAAAACVAVGASPRASAREILEAAIVCTLADTAIRTCEILRLRVCDIDDRALWIRGKGQIDLVRHPSTARACALLLKSCAAYGRTGQDRALAHPGRPRGHGDAAQGVRRGDCTAKIVRAAVGRYFPGVSPHKLRAARASAFARDGAPLHVLQQLLHHEDPKTTAAAYLDDAPERVADLVASLET